MVHTITKQTMQHEPEGKKTLKPEDFGYTAVPGTPDPPPLEKPPFTLKDIRDAIPPHCFNRSTRTSFGYLTADILICLSLFYASTFISYFPMYISVLLWFAYSYYQGLCMIGLWIIAHECGHGAFSDHEIINDTVGLIIHSFLLVPYFSWKFTHQRHHLNAGNCEHDELFAPASRSVVEKYSGNFFNRERLRAIEATPLQNFLSLVPWVVLGWLPFYLVCNTIGPQKYVGQNASHFSPSAVLFSPKQYNKVVLSNLGIFAVFSGFVWIYINYGFTPILFYYLMPMLFLNVFVMSETYLQHTDTYVPHFRGEEWTWIRGALSTVDRSYGKWHDRAVNHGTDTHVCHHLFPSMPFYHASEATAAFREVLGPYYLRDDTPITTALWRAFTNCKYVEDKDSIVFYKRSLK